MAGSTDAKAPAERRDALSEVLADRWWAVGLRGLIGYRLRPYLSSWSPPPAILALILLFSAYMLVDGVLAIASGIKAARNGKRWGLLILEGIVDLAAGAIAFVWPASPPSPSSFSSRVWAIISGALMLGRRLFLEARPWPLVARAWRHRLGHLRHPAAGRAGGGRGRAHVVGRRLCHRVRHHAPRPRLPAARQEGRARGARAWPRPPTKRRRLARRTSEEGLAAVRPMHNSEGRRSRRRPFPLVWPAAARRR